MIAVKHQREGGYSGFKLTIEGAVSVFVITDHRMSDACQLHTDLVRASGDQPDFQKGEIISCINRRVFQRSRFSGSISFYSIGFGIFFKRSLNITGLCYFAFYQYEIFFLNPVVSDGCQ